MVTKRIPRRKSDPSSSRPLRAAELRKEGLIDLVHMNASSVSAGIAGQSILPAPSSVIPYSRHWSIGEPTEKSGRSFVGLGWQPDVSDYRDQDLIAVRCQMRDCCNGAEPPSVCEHVDDPARYLRDEGVRWVDWSAECSPIESQGALGSCTAQSVVSVLEFMMRRAPRWDNGETSTHVELSRLFLYKVTRNLLGWRGDTGAFIRTAFKAVAAFGVPPEEAWPYQIGKFEVEPDAFLYSYASNFKALMYTRLDSRIIDRESLLARIKLMLYHGFLVAFGFPVYTSLGQGPSIPYPVEGDALCGGHAVAAVGFDDDRMVGSERGALIIRNSWGEGWGDVGYGYLPYRYVTEELAQDFWTVFKSTWIRDEVFG